MAFNLIQYIRKTYAVGQLPAYDDPADMNAREAAIDVLSQDHDKESTPGRSLLEAATVAAQRTALDVDSTAEVTAKANAAQSGAESTAAAALAGHVAAPDPHAQYALESELTPALAAKADLVGGKIPAGQLPAYVDDALEFANLAAFPAVGETGKIYVALNTNLTYRWSGSAYVEISQSLALGESSSSAYRGDRGAELYALKGNIPSASEKTALTAGYTHLAKLAAAEAYSALWSYDVAAKMPPALLREIVEAASCGAATVKVDDLGYPSMMYIVRGPILAGHIHSDMGSTTALKTVAITAAGAGYAVNDILTIAGGTGGTVRVLAVDGSGAITSIKIVNPGSGYSAAAGAATTGGTGAGCTITTTIGPVHPAFRVNGVEKTEIFYAMFKGTSYNGTTYHGSGAGWRAVSWPGLFPTGSLDFDASKLLCTNKGAGWHMMTMWEHGLVSWLSMKMSTEPRGNTYYGRSHESGYEYECAVRYDGLSAGTPSGTANHRNSAANKFWSHNADRWGIHDLVGSMWEWRDGMKEVDGLIYMPEDNYVGLAEASWPSTGAYFDNTIATSGGAPRLSNARDNPLVDPNYTTVTHNAMTIAAGYDTLDLAVRQRMLASMLSTKISSAGANPWSSKGTLYNRNYGERLPFVGGTWYTGSNAGLAALDLNDPRSSVGSTIGFRPAFLSLS
jgi:hypothetical protein